MDTSQSDETTDEATTIVKVNLCYATIISSALFGTIFLVCALYLPSDRHDELKTPGIVTAIILYSVGCIGALLALFYPPYTREFLKCHRELYTA